MESKERFAKAIKFTGKKKKEFAEIINVTPTHISRILKGGCEPSIQLCENIEAKFGISSKWLKYEEGDMLVKFDNIVSERNNDVSDFISKAINDIGGDIYKLIEDLSKLTEEELQIVERVCDGLVKSQKRK